MQSMTSFPQATPLRFSLSQLKQLRRTAAPSAAPPALQVPLPVSDPNCSTVFSNKIQINSPYRLESTLLQAFLARDKKLLLVPSRVGKMWASLLSLHQNYLVAAADRIERLLEEKNRIVLVVFPVTPERAYVLQTRVSKLYVDRVLLEYQDPRYETRHRILGCPPLTLRLLPSDLRTALEQEHFHLTRELRWAMPEPTAFPEGHLTDRLTVPGASSPSTLEAFAALPAWSGSLRDLSCGGLCVSLPEAPPPGEDLLGRLLLLEIPLPPVPVEPDEEIVALTLHVLGVIHTQRAVAPAWLLHIKFLERLPEECEALFKRLERGAAAPVWLP